ncbi:hypothetical protein Q4E93_19550 [Flavitalea sp. BT771]|uniref:hypothetical protein n=1 Tax=Flavitalea sp. BT771 TaxID=3063329 RepID=UPI0026E469AD|nr:hypothetical protein [Flavitalea sp. BT771]MDO6432812.1 hypothetical protein [Flavitalea sp. BT771]MDV6221912.1 hypothetical protein [Flavitalea sp. BT771]
MILLLALQLHAFGQKNCDCRIDSSRVLSDKNLDVFLAGLNLEPFQTFKDKKEIPAAIMQQLRCLSYDSFSLGNPGEDYRCCCTSSWKLPSRQLIFLSKSEHYFVMAYKMGGIATWVNVLMLKLENDRIVDLWSGLGNYELKSAGDVYELYRLYKKRKKGELHAVFDVVVI